MSFRPAPIGAASAPIIDDCSCESNHDSAWTQATTCGRVRDKDRAGQPRMKPTHQRHTRGPLLEPGILTSSLRSSIAPPKERVAEK
eukprot:4230868-Alexandrium_andersonii.AAC.2